MMNNNNPNWGWNNSFHPKYEILEAANEESAYKIQMAPDSKTFIMSKTEPLVWLAETDSMGTLSLRAFDLIPHKTPAPIDMNDLLERVKKLEELYVQQSDTKQQQQSNKKQRAPAGNNSAD